MTRHVFNKRHPAGILAVCLAGTCATVAPDLQASDVQVGRYSLLSAIPTEGQADLLATTMTVQFPERIQSVGEAVHYLLQRSGYRQAHAEALDPEAMALLSLPLPAVHRSLGPLTLQQALQILVGPTFRLVQDPVHRLIAFERCAPSWPAGEGVGEAHIAGVPPHEH
jgi:type IV pili sensor histidine kinase/response regulator